MQPRASIRASIRAEVPGLFALALPIVVGLAATTLLGVTDSLMLAPLGPVPLAAVGLTNAAAIIVYASLYGLLSVMSVRIGVAHGAGAARQIPAILRNGLALGAIAGVGGALAMAAIFPLLPLFGQPVEVLAAMPGYWTAMSLAMIPFSLLTVFKSTFEAVGRPWLGTAFAFLGVVVNVPLNYALIWGIGPLPMLGLTGAGIASLAAESLALAAAWIHWQRAPSMRRLRLRRPLDPAAIRATAVEGAPLGLMYVAETGAVAVATLIIGTFGTVALAGNQVAMAVGGVLYMVPLGMAGAVAIRVAQESGAGNTAAQRAVGWAGLGVATLWLSACALFLALAGGPVARAIAPDPGVAATAAAILGVFALMQVFDGVQSTMLGALRGLSDTAWPAKLSMLAYWGVGLPMAWVFAHWLDFGPSGVWLGWLVALAGAGALMMLRFHRRTA